MPGYKPQVKTNSGMVDIPIAATYDEDGNNIVTTYAKKTEVSKDVTVNLNGQDVTDPAFYAPTAAGQAGQVLVSNGAGQAPTWQDAGKDISDAVVTLGASLTFNGSAQTQTVAIVKLGSVTLRAGTDYDISGNVATNAGNYTLIVSGKGDYSGFVFVDWSIAKAQGSISVAESEVEITGPVGTSKQVNIIFQSGYDSLSAVSSAPNIVTAGAAGGVVTLTIIGEGSATVTVNMMGNYTGSTEFSVSTHVGYSVLADNSPAQIRYIADNDLGASYWSIGDTYPVLINGTVGTKKYNNVMLWSYILGFNHNPNIEGTHLIHFGCFKTAQIGGVDVCLVDDHYDDNPTSTSKWFNINHSSYASASGGWKSCDMRYDILGSTDTYSGEPTTTCATDPVSGTLMAAFPADLRAVMRPATKYTDNRGLGNNNQASDVTACQDYLPLLAEFEVFGTQDRANAAEKNYQRQYAYYANGNSKVKYKQDSTGEPAEWWLRSPRNLGNSLYFCGVSPNGESKSGLFTYLSLGVAPTFFI